MPWRRWLQSECEIWWGVIRILLTRVWAFSCSKIRLAFEHTEQRIRAGQSREHATNATSIELAAAADAHVRAYLVRNAVEQTANIRQQVSGPLATVIQQLIELHAIETCERMQADLIRVCGDDDDDDC